MQISKESVYRVDKFIVPSQARDEFLDKVKQTHQLLRTLEGFSQDFILEHISGPGEFNIVTMVIWDGPEFIEEARQAVMAKHKEMNLNPQEMYQRLGIKADIATYRKIDF